MELQLQHLCKHYGTKHAVNDVSTTLTPGYMVCLARTVLARQL